MKNKNHLQKMKENKEKIAMMTAYDYPSAKLCQQSEVDMILVGDSLGMVVLGYDSTIQVTVEDMIHHGKAVKRGADDTFIVVDMPFMSYHLSIENSLMNAKRLYQETGGQALKLEGGSQEVITLVEKLTNAGIPVVGHLGLTPQSVNVLGGYKVQGKDKEKAQKLFDQALQLEKSGAMALVLECVPKELAEMVTNVLSIPTIGIGAGNMCDGQVLVYHDVLYYGVDRLPKFVKKYGDVNGATTTAIQAYVSEVKTGSFPTAEHSFTMDPQALPDKKLED
ncbi:3-methyl-2-oxobutanoate hydroxymethyltransferase [Terrihalobacillus insolitus]|uniref:3-methyl-2-oxobutanoate hydroxymethyltransferase n=1 Tax=Terrihalobacillus insolitus TaxID=2950438 RepID=UPI002341C15A|nr:3-methyl-2-oxobutanoate hydroxymethyltransferase [Terrihalobacillus insolitus]MDC3413028.1 3-methyl-2-oxobutanoate hydroxymethyltransferase [Terrihalobacillus insolitus]